MLQLEKMKKNESSWDKNHLVLVFTRSLTHHGHSPTSLLAPLPDRQLSLSSQSSQHRLSPPPNAHSLPSSDLPQRPYGPPEALPSTTDTAPYAPAFVQQSAPSRALYRRLMSMGFLQLHQENSDARVRLPPASHLIPHESESVRAAGE